MDADLQTHIAFYLTGQRYGSGLDAPEGLGLRPALLAAYRDLTPLRYDFPLVLLQGQADGTFAQPLSALIDGILEKIAHGAEGTRLRRHLLLLEQEIRSRVAAGTGGLFSTVWEQAAAVLGQGDKLMADSLAHARANLHVDGELLDCQASLPAQLLGHAWDWRQAQRAARLVHNVERLVLKLSDILQADFAHSEAGKSAESLQSAFGGGPNNCFDFAAMSRLLTRAAPQTNLSHRRRERIMRLLATLQAQQFFAPPGSNVETTHTFAFDSCCAALAAYRARLPELAALARALTIAELEIKGEYHAARHDVLFAAFGDNGLQASELALFPDYLVRMHIHDLSGVEQDALVEILSADLPIKILIQTDDVLEASPLGHGHHLAFALRSRQLAGMALGLGTAFVLQAPASHLYQLRHHLQRGLDCPGPALFSIFSGATASMGDLPPYLVAAAALESRAFPAFAFDPTAGDDWAARFSLDTNPQPTRDWPVHSLAYEGERHQALSQELAFTLMDFVACDTRYARHFACVPPAHWHAALVSAADTVARQEQGQPDSVPCLWLVDADNCLQKLIVDDKLIREARRCRSLWRSLQELGSRQQATPVEPAIVPAPSVPSEPATPDTPHAPDEAYIETARCSTCNECTQINSKMFAYDNNRQAYIADLSAGTYAQLVEAAESCQVSIIHPGKPRNPDEPGLDQLLKRAELFA